MSTILPERPPVLIDTGVYFNGDSLGEPSLQPSGRIGFGNGIWFENLDALDAVIGHLSQARFAVAGQLLAAESARRDSTPDLVVDAGPCDNDCGGRAISKANGRCHECDEMAVRR